MAYFEELEVGQAAAATHLIEARDIGPHAGARAEGHGAETDFRNEQAGIAESSVTHGGVLQRMQAGDAGALQALDEPGTPNEPNDHP